MRHVIRPKRLKTSDISRITVGILTTKIRTEILRNSKKVIRFSSGDLKNEKKNPVGKSNRALTNRKTAAKKTIV